MERFRRVDVRNEFAFLQITVYNSITGRHRLRHFTSKHVVGTHVPHRNLLMKNLESDKNYIYQCTFKPVLRNVRVYRKFRLQIVNVSFRVHLRNY